MRYWLRFGACGASIDVPLGHKDDVWSFNEIDTMTGHDCGRATSRGNCRDRGLGRWRAAASSRCQIWSCSPHAGLTAYQACAGLAKESRRRLFITVFLSMSMPFIK